MTSRHHIMVGCWSHECRRIEFGILSMPPGWEVWWHGEVEHYMGHGPSGEQSPMHINRFALRRWCWKMANKAGE